MNVTSPIDGTHYLDSVFSDELSIVANASGANDNREFRSDINSDFVATIVTFIFGSIGNIFALLVLFRTSKEQRRCVFYILVACLVTTDLFGLVSSSTLLIGIHTNLFSLTSIELCQLFSFAAVFTRLTTVLIIGAMAVDRYLSLHANYLYNRYFQQRHAVRLVVCILLLALTFAVAPTLGFGRYVLQYPGTWCFFCRYGTDIGDAVYACLFSSLGLLVILLLLVCNLSAIWTLIKVHIRHRRQSFQGHRRTSQNEESTIQRKEQHREIQMAVLLAGIAVTFTTCWGPILVRTIFTTVRRSESCSSSDFTKASPDRQTDMYLIHLASFNQILDPWVYILLRKECLQRGMRLLRWFFCRCRLVSQSVPPLQHQISPVNHYYRRQSSQEYWRRARSSSAMSEDMRGRRKSRLFDRHHSTVTDYQRRCSTVYLCPCCKLFPLPQYVLGKRKPSNFSYFSTARPSTVTNMDDAESVMTATVYQVNGRRMTLDQQSAILVAISEKDVGQNSDISEETENSV